MSRLSGVILGALLLLACPHEERTRVEFIGPIPADPGDVSPPWTFVEAYAISSNGRVVLGSGTFVDDDGTRFSATFRKRGPMLELAAPYGTFHKVSPDGSVALWRVGGSLWRWRGHLLEPVQAPWTSLGTLVAVSRGGREVALEARLPGGRDVQAVILGPRGLEPLVDAASGVPWSSVSTLSRDGRFAAVRGSDGAYRLDRRTDVATPLGTWFVPGAITPDGGTVVGTIQIGLEATLWREGSTLSLGTLGIAKCVSDDARRVVGDRFSGGEAWVWDEGVGTRELADVLASAGVNVEDWWLIDAHGCSADGRTIVGTAWHRTDSRRVGFVAHAVPRPEEAP
jgi:uncharacterized membrane protein